MATKKKTTAKAKPSAEKPDKDPQFRTLTVKVEQKHIDKGEPQEEMSCPVWHALTEQYPGKGWYVTDTLAWAQKPDKEFDLPMTAIAKIRTFDKTGKMKPFEFNLVGYW